jgi:hypothetical protein
MEPSTAWTGRWTGEALGFVIRTSHTSRLDLAPVRFWLRVNERVSVNARTRREDVLGIFLAGGLQCVPFAE